MARARSAKKSMVPFVSVSDKEMLEAGMVLVSSFDAFCGDLKTEQV